MRLPLLVACLGLYFASGIGLTCYNKYFISRAHYGFTFPFTLICAHMVINCVLSGVSLRLFWRDTLRSSPFYPTRITRRVFLRQFAPIGLLLGADIVLTNVSFRYISVSLTEVVKSSVPALLFLSNLLRGRDHTRSFGLKCLKLLNVVLISAGVAFTALGEIGFELRGFLAAIFATLAATLKLISMEALLLEETPHDTNNDDDATTTNVQAETRVGGETRAMRDSSTNDLVALADESGTTSDEPSSRASRTSRKVRSSAYAAVDTRDRADDARGVDGVAETEEGDLEKQEGSERRPPSSSSLHLPLSTEPDSSPPPPSSSASASSRTAHGSGRPHPVLSLFYFTPVSAVALLPFQLAFESSRLASSSFAEAEHWPTTLGLILFGAVVAFGLNASELFVIQATSALTLCIFGVLKFLIVLGISVALFHYELTDINRVGIALTVLGLVVYNYVKWRETTDAAQEVQTKTLHQMCPDADAETAIELDLVLDDDLTGGLTTTPRRSHKCAPVDSPIAADDPLASPSAQGRDDLGSRLRDAFADSPDTDEDNNDEEEEDDDDDDESHARRSNRASDQGEIELQLQGVH